MKSITNRILIFAIMSCSAGYASTAQTNTSNKFNNKSTTMKTYLIEREFPMQVN